MHKHYNYLQNWKWKGYTKLIKMPSWMTSGKRPSGLNKLEGSTGAFKASYLEKGRECSLEVNIDN